MHTAEECRLCPSPKAENMARKEAEETARAVRWQELKRSRAEKGKVEGDRERDD